MARRTHFGVVDQAINSMQQVKEYITIGMETTIAVTMDLVEHDKDNQAGIDQLESVMKNYIKMENKHNRFQEAVNIVKQQASNSQECMDLEAMLEDTLKSLPEQDPETICQHPQYIEMKDKIWDIQHPEQSDSDIAAATGAGSLLDEEDIAMTQQEINIRCPYTGKDMKNPVTNKNCGHNYDKEGILHYIKYKGKKARCPFGGCANDQPIDVNCLEENKDLKKYIERKARHAGKKAKTCRSNRN